MLRFIVYFIAIAVFSIFVSYLDVVASHKFGVSKLTIAFWFLQGPAVWLIPTGGGFLIGSAKLDLTKYFIFFLFVNSIMLAIKFNNRKINSVAIIAKISIWLFSAFVAMCFFKGA